MLAQLSKWIVIAALSQAPPEAALLKAVPADVDVAIRIRGVEAARHDLVAMVKAMNPDWAAMVEQALEQPLAQFKERHGDPAYRSPWIALLRVAPPAEGGPPAAIVLPSDDYKGVLKAAMGGKDVELKPQEGGYDSFDGPEGHGTWYAAHRPGVVAFGPDQSLVAQVAKAAGKGLDQALSPAAAQRFLSGDLGLYVNAAALSARYADQIDQGRQTFMGLMDQVAAQQGNEAMVKFIKDFYGGLFDSIKSADKLTLDLDFATEGLHLAGCLDLKADADAAKTIATAHTSAAPTLGHLGAGATFYAYLDLEARTFERLMGMSRRLLNPGDKPSPALEKALGEFQGLGRIETTGAFSMGNGMRGLSEFSVSDPRKYIDATLAMLEAMKGAGESPLNVYKDIKVERDAKTCRGIAFTQIITTVDLDKLTRLAGNNPAQAEGMKAMFGGGTVSYWYGTDGRRAFQVMAPNWDDAKAQVESYLDGKDGIGATAAFKAVRSQLPEQASLLVLLSTQGLIRMFASQFAAMFQNPDLKVPADLPKDPVFLGVSLTPRAPAGYEFHLVVPSSVGPVVNKGLIPILQGLRPPGGNQ
jgi:hypothetical protein